MNFERIPAGQINPDLTQERLKATFSINSMTKALYGEENLDAVTQLKQILADNPVFDLKHQWHVSKKERYLRACQIADEFVKLCRRHRIMDNVPLLHAFELLCGEDMFILLHITMFTTCVENLVDDEQRGWWVKACKEFNMIGTYAQTELGHGSNVAGLETTADLDFTTDEWVLNTPTLKSTKWWPGGMAKSCTHCILMARMRVSNKDLGVHAFMLPLRDMNTHQSLPGIHLVDIGQKLGYNGMDNGGLQLKGVRIPRRFLMGRFCQVDKQGNYKKISNEKLLYATMTFTRKQIVAGAGVSLARGAVIATRYSAVRRQFMSTVADMEKATGNESQVLDYSTQLYATMPMLATAAAFVCGAGLAETFYAEFINEINSGDFSRLSEIHVLTSAMKAHYTSVTADGLESCRRACGGHGFMLAAGIPLHYTSYVPQATYEGDAVVLAIQTGRAILRLIQQKIELGSDINENDPKVRDIIPPRGSTLRYIWAFDHMGALKKSTKGASVPQPDWTNPSWQLKAYQERACVLMYSVANSFAQALASGDDMLQALDKIKIELTRLTSAHSHVVTLNEFQKRVSEVMKSDKTTGEVLRQQCDLYCLYWMDKDLSQFIGAGVVSGDHETQSELMRKIKQILQALRVNAVALADSWALPDYLLNSALGRYDGMVYQALFESTKSEALNAVDVTEGYYRHIQYILHPERRSDIGVSKL